MKIKELTLEGFRNYERAELTFDGGCNVIYGENAQGKTNLLEAIAYLSCGKSPRAHADRELIGFEKDTAHLCGVIESRQREFKADITLQRGRRRKITVNGVAAKNAAALSDVLHTVFFSPEDLYLIREGAAARRRFMDISSVSCVLATPRRWRNITAFMSTRPVFCATVRSIPSFWLCCRISMPAFVRWAPCSSATAPDSARPWVSMPALPTPNAAAAGKR